MNLPQPEAPLPLPPMDIPRQRHRIPRWAVAPMVAVAAAACVPNETLPAQMTADIPAANANMLDGTWQYMPGVIKNAAGDLEVSETDLALHNYNDGNNGNNGVYQELVPVNLYGSRGQATGDFAVQQTVKLSGTSKFTAAYLGQTPLIFDDFEHPRKGTKVEVTNSNATVHMFDGVHKDPYVTQSAPLQEVDSDKVIRFTKAGGQIGVSIDGQTVASATDTYGMFATPGVEGNVWFGMDTDDGNALVPDLTMQGMNGGTVGKVDTSTITFNNANLTDGLRYHASRIPVKPDFGIGSGIKLPALMSDRKLGAIYATTVKYGTDEENFKHQLIHPRLDKYEFGPADAIVDFHERHGIKTIGHPIYWHKALPKYMAEMPTSTEVEKATARQAILDHTRTVAEHFNGRVHEWEINEIFGPTGGINDSVGIRAFGTPEALTGALVDVLLDVNPDNVPSLNQYATDQATPTQQAVFDETLQLALSTGAKKVGFQAHSYTLFSDPTATAARMAQANAAGIDVAITEMDVTNYIKFSVGGVEQSIDVRIPRAALFGNMMLSCAQAPNCDRFTVWGLGNNKPNGNGVYTSTTGIRPDGTLDSSSNSILNDNLDVGTADEQVLAPSPYTDMVAKLKALAPL